MTGAFFWPFSDPHWHLLNLHHGNFGLGLITSRL